MQSSVLVEFGGGNGNFELLIGLELVGQGIGEKEVACGGGNRSLLGVIDQGLDSACTPKIVH